MSGPPGPWSPRWRSTSWPSTSSARPRAAAASSARATAPTGSSDAAPAPRPPPSGPRDPSGSSLRRGRGRGGRDARGRRLHGGGQPGPRPARARAAGRRSGPRAGRVGRRSRLAAGARGLGGDLPRRQPAGRAERRRGAGRDRRRDPVPPLPLGGSDPVLHPPPPPEAGGWLAAPPRGVRHRGRGHLLRGQIRRSPDHLVRHRRRCQPSGPATPGRLPGRAVGARPPLHDRRLGGGQVAMEGRAQRAPGAGWTTIPSAPRRAQAEEVAGTKRYKGGYVTDPGSIASQNNFAHEGPGGYGGDVIPSFLPADLAGLQTRLGPVDLDPGTDDPCPSPCWPPRRCPTRSKATPRSRSAPSSRGSS